MGNEKANQRLRAARKEKCWSMALAAEKAQVSWLTYSRWENGLQKPYLSTLRQLCEAFGKTPQELGFADLVEEPVSEHTDNPVAELTSSPRWIENEAILSTTLLQLEAIMLDPTKRKTLEALLAALSLALVNPQGIIQTEAWQHLLAPTTEHAKPNDLTIQGFQSLINACWQLSRGNELALGEKLLPECMSRLVPLAQSPSPYQKAAAHLAAQGYQLYGIFALHKNNILASQLYYKQAVEYSLLSENPHTLVASLRMLADDYRYNHQHQQFLQTYLDAVQYIEKISPLFQSCIYRGVAMAYAYAGQKQEALTYLNRALETFPVNPTSDPSFAFAEFDLPWLIMGEGIVRTHLGHTQQALEIFQRIDQPGINVPERIRLEILNQQATTAIASGDLEQSAAYIEAGITGAKTLGSQRRLNEAYDNYNQMFALWPQEQRVKTLGELFQA